MNTENLNRNYSIAVDDNIIIVNVFKNAGNKEDNDKMMEMSTKEVQNILKKNPGQKYSLMVNLGKTSKSQHYSHKSRQLNSQLMTSPQIIKAAIVGPSVFVKVLVNFMANATGKTDTMKWFTNQEQALEWLKSAS